MKTKTYKKITHDRLKECLGLVGWRIRPAGCDYYNLVNQFGKNTSMSFFCEDGKQILNELRLEDFGGETPEPYIKPTSMIISLSKAQLDIHYKEDKSVSFLSLAVRHDDFIKKYDKQGNGAFINFYKKK